jgi:hypothetical protein
MRPSGSRSATQPLLTLTPADEAILRFLSQVRVSTARMVAHALFSPGSLTTVRARLRRLSGGGVDYAPRSPLVRFPLPSANGNPVRVFTLGSRGRDFIRGELGLPLPTAYYRPSTVLSFSFLRHTLLCTSAVVAVRVFVRRHPEMTLRECRLSYELSRRPELKVIPDLWVRLEGRESRHAIFLEADNSSMYRAAFTKRLAARIQWVRSGEYRTLGVQGLLVAYVVAGETAQAAQSRLQTVSKWTVETVKALGLKESWAGLFRFTSVGTIDEVYEQGIFERAVWYRADAPDTPVPLFEP